MNWRWITVTALFAALVIAYGALTKRDVSADFASAPPVRPGYYLRNAVITQTEQDGSLRTQLAAARIELQPANDDLQMTDVQLNYFQTPVQEWRLTADRGFKPSDSPIFEFSGDVQLRPAQGDPNAVLQVEALAIDTQKDLAYSTSSPVQIRFGQHRLEAGSFEFDLESEQIQMQSIQGRYETS